MTLSGQYASTTLLATATASASSVSWKEKIGATGATVLLPLATTGFECSGYLGGGGDDFTLDVAAGSGAVTGSGEVAYRNLAFSGNAVAGETVTIDGIVYTWRATVSTIANEVKIGATDDDSIDNLVAAINGGAGSGTVYGSLTVAHTTVSASNITGALNVAAVTLGLAGNSIAVTETMTNAAWGGSTLSGGYEVSTLTGADGKDMEGNTLTALVKVIGLRIRCTAGSLTIASSGNITDFYLAVGGEFLFVDPAGSTDLIAPDLVLTGLEVGSAFSLEVLGAIV